MKGGMNTLRTGTVWSSWCKAAGRVTSTLYGTGLKALNRRQLYSDCIRSSLLTRNHQGASWHDAIGGLSSGSINIFSLVEGRWGGG